MGRFTTNLSIEVAKCLQLVVPASMTADDRAAWIQAATDSLEDIRADEVAAVSAEVRRTVTNIRQIVPEIAKLVSDRRRRLRDGSTAGPANPEWAIDREAQRRRGMAKSRSEIEDAAQWERQARLDAGLAVPPHQPPLSQSELATMPQHIAKLGLAYGFLEKRDGKLVEA